MRQVDDVNPASKLIKPQDIVTDVNGVSVRGQKLSAVLKVCVLIDTGGHKLAA